MYGMVLVHCVSCGLWSHILARTRYASCSYTCRTTIVGRHSAVCGGAHAQDISIGMCTTMYHPTAQHCRPTAQLKCECRSAEGWQQLLTNCCQCCETWRRSSQLTCKHCLILTCAPAPLQALPPPLCRKQTACRPPLCCRT